VERGVIHVLGIPVTVEKQEFGYIATQREFSDFHIRVKELH
jgi:mannose-1-phosphate guanylyltransferase